MQKIEALIEDERFERALATLDRLKRFELDRSIRFHVQLLGLECWLGLRRFAAFRELAQAVDSSAVNSSERARFELLIAHSLAITGEARDALQRAFAILRRKDVVESLKARANWVAGLALYRRGHYSWAKEFLNDSASYYRLARNRPALADVLMNLGLVAKSVGRLDVALDYFDDAARLIIKTPRSMRWLDLLLDRGICLYRLGQMVDARSCFLQATSIARVSKSDHQMVAVLNNLGHVFRAEGNHEAARESYEKALRHAESLGTERKVCLTLEFIAESLHEEGRSAEAMLHLDRALDLAKKLAPRGDLMMEVLRRRGETQFALGNHQEALRDLKRAIRLCSARGERREQVLAERAYAFVASKSDEELGERLQKVLIELDRLGDRYEYARTVYLALETGRLTGERCPWFAEASAAAVHYFNSLGSRVWRNRFESLLGRVRNVTIGVDRDAVAASRATTSNLAYAHTLDEAHVIARISEPVLILGETGVGKEVIAQLLHQWGSRASRPMLAINCGTLPENLADSELFGHARGAFTGALQDRAGLFESADGGTVLLDEVADLPLHTQVKLLRFLDTGEVRRVGDSKPRRADVRVLAATNKDLEALVSQEKFRQDLYFRLSVFTIHVPPLRERREDILSLAEAFIRESAQSRLPIRFSNSLQGWLERYDWPGNVRELRNVCKHLAVHAWGKPEIDVVDLPSKHRPGADPPGAAKNPFARERLDLERAQLVRALRETKGRVPAAARLLGIGRNQIYIKLRAHGLDIDTFRH